jgi:hypothetical protein
MQLAAEAGSQWLSGKQSHIALVLENYAEKRYKFPHENCNCCPLNKPTDFVMLWV